MKGVFLARTRAGRPSLKELTVGYDYEVPADVIDAHPMKHPNALRDDPQCLPWSTEFPTRDGEESVRLQVVEVLAKGLDGIKIVLTQGESTS